MEGCREARKAGNWTRRKGPTCQSRRRQAPFLHSPFTMHRTAARTPTATCTCTHKPVRPPAPATPLPHPAPAATTVDIPSFAGLTDAQKRSAMKKLAGALKRIKQVGGGD